MCGWFHTERVALTAEQVEQYELPPIPGKTTDSRAASFRAAHGRLVQVEIEALDPLLLHRLFDSAVARWWSVTAHAEVLAAEEAERAELR